MTRHTVDRRNSASPWIEIIVAALRRHRERIAVVDGDRELTYAGLSAQISRFADALRAQGLRSGDGVALLAYNTVEAHIALLATQVAGLRYTPLHPLGGVEDHRWIIDDGEAKALIVCPNSFPIEGQRLAAVVSNAIPVLTLGECKRGIDIVAAADRVVERPIEEALEIGEVVSILYTGGTTGRPKGVIHPQRTYAAHFLTSLAEYGWPSRPVSLVSSPFSHTRMTFIAPTLHRGGTLILMPRFESDKALELIQRHRVNATWLVPTMVYKLLDHPSLEDAETSSIERIWYGGGPIITARLAEALARLGPVFAQTYGQTETITATLLPPEDHDGSHPERLASCGRAIAGMRTAILDEDGTVLPPGQVGEIGIAGGAVADGYWKLPELSAERFIDGWKRSGDIGYMDKDGYVYHVDRREDMIVSGGFNVYPSDVENALGNHPDVLMSAVFGVPDSTWGEAVRAAVVLRDGANVAPEELRQHVRTAKGPVATPKQIDLRSTLPLTAIGKVDRKTLRAELR